MNILLVNHHAGSPALGMEYRPYYLAREWVRLGHSVQILAADFSHVRGRQPTCVLAPDAPNWLAGDEVVDGIGYRWFATPPCAATRPAPMPRCGMSCTCACV